MTVQKNVDSKLENFDDIWGLGNPAAIEKKFHELLPQAESLNDKSIYLQILSQIALAQALQKKFDEAHTTLNRAEALLTPGYELARIRLLLERGRVYQQAGDNAQARKYFEQSYELSKKNNFDYYTIDAAHMIAIVAENTQDKVHWNRLAADLATATKNKRAQDWLGSLHNNLGRNYMEAHQYQQALEEFQKALAYREKEGHASNIRVAKWQIACALRLLGRLDEALAILLALVQEYDDMAQSGKYDVPVMEAFNLARGLAYEEIALIYRAKTQIFAKLAYDDLSPHEMFHKSESYRLERLKELQNGKVRLARKKKKMVRSR